jgi:hypothetical protein
MAIFNPPSMNLNFNNDPLGIGVIGRAQDARNRDLNDSFSDDINSPGWGGRGGPLPDPAWQGLMQAFSEKGVDKLVGGNVPNSRAFSGQNLGRERWGTIPNATGVEGEMAQPQMLPGYGAPDNRLSIMNGLTSAFKPEDGVGGNYQTHEQWMGSNPAAQAYQGQFGIEKQNIANPRNRRATGMPVLSQRGTTGANISQRYSKPDPNE